MTRFFQLALLSVGLFFLSGCQDDCKAACKKIIVECEAGIPSYNTTQCEEDCTSVRDYYETYDYLATDLAAFEEQLNCIQDASCEELLDPDAPACYDNQLFEFE
jgi:hypothetical protein